jgi:hypothetical protein
MKHIIQYRRDCSSKDKECKDVLSPDSSEVFRPCYIVARETLTLLLISMSYHYKSAEMLATNKWQKVEGHKWKRSKQPHIQKWFI